MEQPPTEFAGIEELFNWIGKTFFPGWDEKRDWRIAIETPEYDATAECNRERNAVLIAPSLVDLIETEHVIAIIIHEVCHAISGPPHGREHSTCLERAKKKAEELNLFKTVLALQHDIQANMELESAAYHEAAHAVACVKSGFEIIKVTIDDPDPSQPDRHCDHFGNFIDGKSRDPEDKDSVKAYDAEVRHLLAGVSAEKKLGLREDGAIETDLDYTRAKDTLEELYGSDDLDSIIARRLMVENKAREFVDEHWDAIEAFAQELLRKITIEGKEAVQFIIELVGKD